MRKREFWESEEGLQLAELWARDGEDDRAIARRMRVPERTLLRWKRAGGPLGEALLLFRAAHFRRLSRT